MGDAELQVSELQIDTASVRCWDASQNGKVVRKEQRDSGPEFIGDADSFKRLFALPVTKWKATFAVHRVGGTLVLDGGDECIEQQQQPSEKYILDDGGVIESKNGEALLDGIAPALLLERHVATALSTPYPYSVDDQGSEDSYYGNDDNGNKNNDDNLCVNESALDLSKKNAFIWNRREYGVISAWRLAEIRLVSGVDSEDCNDTSRTTMSTFSNDQQQIRRLAVLDSWLDNILTGAPRLAERLREHGLVAGGLEATKFQGKKQDLKQVVIAHDENNSTPIRNEDINPCADDIFDSSHIEIQAAALLRFLYENCEKDGATYVLSREYGGVIKLFDLGALCDHNKRRWKWYLATLSVRLARQLEAHLVADAEQLLSQRVARELRSRQRLLLETASELFAEIAELKGGKHLLMRASVHEQLAATYFAEHTTRKTNTSFFSPISETDDSTRPEIIKTKQKHTTNHPPARLLGLEALRCCDADALEKARRQLRIALELVSQEDELIVFADRAEARRLELCRGVVDATLALARQHLDNRRPSGLMHELKIAANEIRFLTSDSDSARIAALWHCAAAFSYGVATERFIWAECGALECDALTLLYDLQEALPEDVLDESPSLRAALARLVEPRALHHVSKRDLIRLRAVFNIDSSFFSTSQAKEKQALLLAVAKALGTCLRRASTLPGNVVTALSGQLAEVCSRLAVFTSDMIKSAEGQSVAIDWIVTALAYAVTSSLNNSRLLISIRLNWCVFERRLALLCNSNENYLQEALRQTEAAAALLGSEQDSVWTQVHEELAISNLHLGTARRKNNNNCDERLVLDPLRAALRAHEKLRGSESTQVAADSYQIAAYLLQRYKRRLENINTSLQHKKNKLLFDEALEHFCSAKSIFNAHKLPSHVVLAALGISDLLDTRCRHLSSSPHTQIRENPIGLALASLVELTEARASLRATKEGGESRRAVASRLPDRAKTLLQIAMASNNTSIISYCKAIYQTVLTRDTQVEDMLDAAASAIHPLIELFDSTPSEDAEIEGTATQQESHVTSSISTTTNKKRKKKKKKHQDQIFITPWCKFRGKYTAFFFS
uniref:Erythroid differentiation-related factor 1 n=1 Tax=Aureoumbra lagunensis TaxID=44058 RepID=A0A7S3JTY7_9STRA|mmetsp:Transcript_15070/g.22620  ORF Transcript_15070/g.22620 Transcript_15070/m.22620 type:complete len:1076 (-) Transcript_15070:1438-4665(-)